MDTIIMKDENGKKYNQLGQQVIQCSICGERTTMLGTEHCDRFHELDSRIRRDIDIAERLVNCYRKRV